MPRNGSGTFTLVSGNPVVTGTTIESNWANTTLSDIATTLTDSLSRSGQGGMTAALRVADGTQGAPGVGFANETGSGFYRAGTGEVWAVVQGAQTLNLDANGVYVPADKTTTVDGAFVFNEAGADKDARFEGDTDANLLFVDASTDRVGVGTNAPGTKLDVSVADGTNAIAANGSSVGGFIALRPDGTNGQAIRVGGSGAGSETLRFLGSADAEYMRLSNAGLSLAATSNLTLNVGTANGVAYLNASKVLTTGSRLTFDGSEVFTNTGGTIQYNDVKGSAAAGTRLSAGGTLGTDSFDLFQNASGAWVYNRANTPITFGVNNAPAMTLTSTGLGIGLGGSSPGATLHVAGSSGSVLIQPTNAASALLNMRHGSIATNNYFRVDSNSSTVFGTSGSDKATLDASGNLGLGVTPSAWSGASSNFQLVAGAFIATSSATARYGANYYYASAYKYTTSDYATLYQQSAGQHQWHTAPSWNGTGSDVISFTQAMTLDASGNLAIGETNAQGYRLNVNVGGSSTTRLANDALRLASNGSGADVNMNFTDGVANNAWIGMVGGNLYFDTGGTERARITSGGDLLVGTTSQPVGGVTARLAVSQSAADYSSVFVSSQSTGANCYGARIQYTAAAPNGTGNPFLVMLDTGGDRAVFRSNGGLANYSANDVNLSDRREKTNFAPAKSYLDTICSIPVQTFEYIDQSPDDPGLTLGVVAQDVQAVAPELVMESNWGTEDNPKMRLSIYQTDLQYALMKCIQEQQALITDLRARVAALEAQP